MTNSSSKGNPALNDNAATGVALNENAAQGGQYQQIALGDQVVDPVTGFQGTATGRMERLHGVPLIVVEPQGLSRKGKPLGAMTFEESRLRQINVGQASQRQIAQQAAPAPARAVEGRSFSQEPEREPELAGAGR